MQVELEFNYALADLRESLVPEKFAANPEKYARRWIRTAVIWAIAALVGAIDVWLNVWLNRRFPIPHRPEPPDVPYDLRTEFLPSVLPALWVFTVYILTIRLTWRGLRRGERVKAMNADPISKVIHLLVSAAIGLVAGIGIAADDWDSIVRMSPARVALLAVAPWCVLVISMQILGVLQRRGKIVGEWRRKPSWRRAKSVRLDETGFVLRDPLYQFTFNWAYFSRARETKNLLIIVSEGGTEYLIPKRAFAHPADLERCRSLLQNAVPKTRFLVRPVGFAVLPHPVLPLPELAAESAPQPTLTASKERVTMHSVNELEAQQ
ncbi:MAG TPA: YcxB family protein [Tepidisphaeraceae bacterium]|jgi:hypothetical protein